MPNNSINNNRVTQLLSVKNISKNIIIGQGERIESLNTPVQQETGPQYRMPPLYGEEQSSNQNQQTTTTTTANLQTHSNKFPVTIKKKKIT